MRLGRAFPHAFFDDVPTIEDEQLAKKQRPISGAAFGAPSAVAAWDIKPSYYAISANDMMVAKAFFAKRMNATTVTLQSSHASPVSHPDEVAALIDQAAIGPWPQVGWVLSR
jgi:hypothetical protein